MNDDERVAVAPGVTRRCGGSDQALMAAVRAYRDDPKRNGPLFVEAIHASTNYDHRSLKQVSEVTGYSEVELKGILGE
jgi:hypothetical protein